ncbi:MAG: SDR family oxidoreductase [Rickettsiales bacterium]|jgi:enoyl-[acyl-carrier protein] reductase I|nr:SDR family oxidoreductase [Rickettsiales bacterium]
MSDLMKGKKGIICGIANERSMAWGIAQAVAAEGAAVAVNYSSDMMEKRVRPLAESIGSPVIMPMDVQDDATLDAFFTEIGKKMGRIDFLLHAIAFSNKDELSGLYVDNTTRENFKNTMDISVYSFTDMCRRAACIANEGASFLTLTYLGGETYIPNYNVMGVAKAALDASVKYLASDLGNRGIRVNAISAGPIKTLAAAGIDDFKLMMRWNEYNSFLGRNMSMEDVSKAGMYMLSNLSSGVTGEVHHVDCGYHAQGMINIAHTRESSDMLAEYADRLERKES